MEARCSDLCVVHVKCARGEAVICGVMIVPAGARDFSAGTDRGSGMSLAGAQRGPS